MKTHQEKLNELTTEIRKSIPRLMELDWGCEIISKIEDFFNDVNIGEKYTLGENAEFDGEDIVIGEYCYGTINFTIIGHEPLLNDVLEWHSLNGRCKYSHFEVSKGEAYFSIYDGEENESIVWDLSKSKLSDQSEELINFLHDLIPNK